MRHKHLTKIGVDWKTVTNSVNQMQIRITKAVNITAARNGYERFERYEGKLSRTVLWKRESE